MISGHKTRRALLFTAWHLRTQAPTPTGSTPTHLLAVGLHGLGGVLQLLGGRLLLRQLRLHLLDRLERLAYLPPHLRNHPNRSAAPNTQHPTSLPTLPSPHTHPIIQLQIQTTTNTTPTTPPPKKTHKKHTQKHTHTHTHTQKRERTHPPPSPPSAPPPRAAPSRARRAPPPGPPPSPTPRP
jgi:hypothetical protein